MKLALSSLGMFSMLFAPVIEAAFSVANYNVGETTDYSMAAGECLILNMTLSIDDSPFGGDDYYDDDLGYSKGRIKNSFLWTKINAGDSSNKGNLDYFAVLIPYSYYHKTDLVNNPNVLLASNSSCWDSYDDVGTAGFYNHSLTKGVSPISYDMSSTFIAQDFGATDDRSGHLCHTYLGKYYFVLKAVTATTVTVNAKIYKQGQCNSKSGTTAILALTALAALCCCPCIFLGYRYHKKKQMETELRSLIAQKNEEDAKEKKKKEQNQLESGGESGDGNGTFSVTNPSAVSGQQPVIVGTST